MALVLKQSDVTLILSALGAEADNIFSALQLIRRTGMPESTEAAKALKERGENIHSLQIAFQLSTTVTLSREGEEI